MSFFDWNKDGKIDLQDAYLEYNIFRRCTEDVSENDDLVDLDDDYEEYDDFFDE